MAEKFNRVVRARRFGEIDGLEVVDLPLPNAKRGEVRVRVLASGIEFTDTLIRRHRYPQTMFRRAPLVMGYDVVGEIDQLGTDVHPFGLGDRVADLTVVGSNASYRTLAARNLVRVPPEVDPVEAAALILSWMTAHQLLHRAANVQAGQRVLVQGGAGAVGQALIVLGRLAGLEIWSTAKAEHADLLRELGATPIDYEREDYTRALSDGFDAVFDGLGQGGYDRPFEALRPGGVVCAFGYSAGVPPDRGVLAVLAWLARQYLRYLWVWRPTGRRLYIYSINLMRARHFDWFKADLEYLFSLLQSGNIRPRISERISFDKVADVHRLLELGGLQGKIVLCPDLSSPSEQVRAA